MENGVEERRGKKEDNEGKAAVPLPKRRTLASSEAEVKLAAMALWLSVRPRMADMPPTMQERAFRCARTLVDAAPAREPVLTCLARAIKKEFDDWYGPAWHCVVGRSFGSFVTHSSEGFVYFTLDERRDGQEEGECSRGRRRSHLCFLLFQTHLIRVKNVEITKLPGLP